MNTKGKIVAVHESISKETAIGKNIVVSDYTVSNDNGVLTINVKNFAVAK